MQASYDRSFRALVARQARVYGRKASELASECGVAESLVQRWIEAAELYHELRSFEHHDGRIWQIRVRDATAYLVLQMPGEDRLVRKRRCADEDEAFQLAHSLMAEQ